MTIWSVVGIPPVLVAGIYGMNFTSCRSYVSPTAIRWVSPLIAVSALVPLGWFKWRGWW